MLKRQSLTDCSQNVTTATACVIAFLLFQIGIELGHFLKADISQARLIETLLIFATSWLTWFHTNLMLVSLFMSL